MFFRRRDAAPRPAPEPPSDLEAIERGRSAGRTVIGPQTRVRGTLRGRGGILVCGGVRGEIAIDGILAIAPGAVVEADAAVGSARVGGFARGALRASASVQVERAGEIAGDIATPTLSLRPGAVLNGRASVAGPPPRDRSRAAR